MSELERRYTRLVRWCYPAGYRRRRGTEIVDTYLALAAPDRRRPSVADVIDLALGGLRERQRAIGATGIGPGIGLAGTLALLATTALAAGWTPLEAGPLVAAFGPDPFFSLGVAVWAAWLLAAVVHAAAPGRWTRLAIGAALAVTVAVVPLAAVTGLFRPPLFVLVPQAALGLVALGAPGRPPVWLRLLPLAVAAAALPAAANFRYSSGPFYESGPLYYYYDPVSGQALSIAGVTLLLVMLLLGGGLALRNDVRGAWATLVLLGPIGTLWLHPLAGELAVRRYGGGPTPTWSTLVTAAIIVAAIVAAVVAPALALLVRTAGKRAAGNHASR
jgi:hypothetical protein